MDERLDEVRRLVHEHLNAAMIMVRLDDPLDPDMPIADALSYLDENEFDLALLRTPEVRVIYRERLRGMPAHAQSKPIKANAYSPRADRLIEHSLELGEVARRLQEDDVPLLVIGRDGPEFIITRSDFTRPAGLAGVLAVIAALDAQLDELLRPFDSEAWPQLDEEKRAKVEQLLTRARQRSEEVHRLSYLTLGDRFFLVRDARTRTATPHRPRDRTGTRSDNECPQRHRTRSAGAERSGRHHGSRDRGADSRLDPAGARPLVSPSHRFDARRNDARPVRAPRVVRALPLVPPPPEGDARALPRRTA